MDRPHDSLRADAVAKRDAALAEFNRWGAFIAMLDELRPESARSDGAEATYRAMQRRNGTPREPSQQATGALAETQAAVVEILRTAGRSMHTRDLLPELQKQGIEVGGQDPASTLSARLSRAPLLENTRRDGWSIRREQVPEEGTKAAGEYLAGPPPAVFDDDEPQAPAEAGSEVGHGNIDPGSLY